MACFFVRKHNYKCDKCGIIFDSPLDMQYLNVYHKNGDKSNNNEDNLKVLCPNCHSLTSNYGSNNRGKSKRDR